MTANTNEPKSKAASRKEDSEKAVKAFITEHPFQFVNLPLGDGEKEEILASPINPERLSKFVLECCINQYKLSINWDNKSRCYIVSMTGQKFWRDDYNLCVTSRHNDLWVVLAIAEYKYFRLIQSNGIDRPANGEREIFD